MVVLGASDLAAANSDGTSDPYAKVTVKPPDGPKQERRTREVRGTVSPEWKAVLAFGDVHDSKTEVTILIKDWNRIGGSKPLGQVEMRLDALGLPRDGSLVEKDMELNELSPRDRLRTVASLMAPSKAQGTVRFLIGWRADGIGVAAEHEYDLSGFVGPTSPGDLTVVVLGARGLAAADSNGKSDPYAKLKVNTGTRVVERQTEVVKRSLDPSWCIVLSSRGAP